jgi:Ferritin-like domain
VSPRFTRRGVLGGAAALALASCGGGDPAPAGGARAGSGAATLSSIVALEHAAVAAWATIADQLTGDAAGYARAIRGRQAEHANQLSKLVRGAGAAPPSARAASSYAPSFPRLTSAADALHFARDLQERLVRAYFEGLVVLHDAGQRRAVAEIGAAQAEDLAVVHSLAGDPVAPQAFVTGTS